MNLALETRALPDVADLINEDEERRLAMILEALYAKVLKDMHVIVTDSLDLDPLTFRLPDAEARDWAARHAAARVTMISETTRAALRDVIADGIEEGKSTYEIMQDIESLYLNTWPNRPEVIARTEVGQAQREAAINRYAATGLVDRVTIRDGDDDSPCRERNGTTVPLERAPDLAHPQCTLILIPVLKEGVI